MKINKKAIILTLDAMLAFIVTFLILGAASSYITKGNDVLPNLQISRTGSDVVTLLDNTKTLQTLNQNTIQNELGEILPESFGMRMNITWQDSDLGEEGNIEVGDSLPEKKFVATGKRFFVVINESISEITDYGVVKWWTWLK